MFRIFLASLLIWVSAFTKAEEITLYAENAPPNAYVESGELKGRTIDIVTAVLNEIGRSDLEIKMIPWARGYHLLSKQKNVGLFPVARTADREHKFRWAGQIMPNMIFLYRLKGRNDIVVDSLEDIKNYRLGLTRADIKDQFLSKYTNNKDYVPEDKLNFLKAINGRIDLFPYASARFNYEVKLAGLDPDKFEKVYLLDSISTSQYLAFNENTDDEIVKAFQAGFNRLWIRGDIDKILKDWKSKY